MPDQATRRASRCAIRQSSAALKVCSCVMARSVRSKQSRINCPKKGNPNRVAGADVSLSLAVDQIELGRTRPLDPISRYLRSSM